MATEEEKRIWLILFAWKEVLFGSHYLKGAKGAIPDLNNSGLSGSLEIVEDLDINSKTFGVHAAKNGYGTCPGRWEKVTGGKQFVKGQKDRDELLPQYLEKLKTAFLPDQWESFNNTGLYPRRAYDYIYLGEDCRNKRHFDCESFIAWVLIKGLGKDKGTWAKGVDWYQSGGNGRLDVYQAEGANYVGDGKTINKADILDGDILIRKPSSTGGEHIAFACAGGNGVLEASGRNRGVVFSPYKANWTQLARIKKL